MVAEANKRSASIFGVETTLVTFVEGGRGKDTSTLTNGSTGKRGATYLSIFFIGVDETIL